MSQIIKEQNGAGSDGPAPEPFGNQMQNEAVRHGTGPLLVLAGPGSGKTFVITRRIRNLIEQYGADPTEILVITFTKAAAREMKQRFQSLCENQECGVNFGTFHAVFYHILKSVFHYNSNNIITEYEKREIIRTIGMQPGFDFTYDTEFCEAILSEISYLKNMDLQPDTYAGGVMEQEQFAAFFASYQDMLERKRKLDFDDMVQKCRNLFQERPDVLKGWQKKFRYILIDEFQDINPMQYEVVRMLAEPENNLFVVGDDDQSIYSFRGGGPEIMLGFTKDYPQSRQLLLDVNYRSRPEVVKQAVRIIRENRKRFDKKITASRSAGEKDAVELKGFSNKEEEYTFLISDVIRQKKSCDYKDMAFIFRTNSDASYLSEKLAEAGIPFAVKEKINSIYRHFIARDLLACLFFALEKQRRAEFFVFMNKPTRYLNRMAVPEEEVSFDTLLAFYREKPYMVSIIRKLQLDLARIKKMSLFAAVNYIRKGMNYDEYLKQYCEEKHVKYGELSAVADQLQRRAGEFASLEAWKEHIREYEAQLAKNSTKNSTDKEDAVQVMTMHASKGLEFDIVYLPDCNEGMIPHKKSTGEAALEEERRMFYVAMTRARNRLVMTYVSGTKQEPVMKTRFLRKLKQER